MLKKIKEWFAWAGRDDSRHAGKSENSAVMYDHEAPYTIEMPKANLAESRVEMPITVTEVPVMTISPKISIESITSLNKKELMNKAKELGVAVNTRMTKEEMQVKILKS